MFDEDGKVRSFAQFRKAAEPIVAGYNERWLQTEYDTAIIRAGHAAQWRNREHERTLYPNLEWLASTSATPREGHKPFYGLVLPEVDPFWQSNYPGSLWGCKCGIRSTAAPVTPKNNGALHSVAHRGRYRVLTKIRLCRRLYFPSHTRITVTVPCHIVNSLLS